MCRSKRIVKGVNAAVIRRTGREKNGAVRVKKAGGIDKKPAMSGKSELLRQAERGRREYNGQLSKLAERGIDTGGMTMTRKQAMARVRAARASGKIIHSPEFRGGLLSKLQDV